jgi:SAM-dependent methyltransferase
MEETIYDYFSDKYENCNTYLRLGDMAYSKEDWPQAVWWYQIANFNCSRTLDGWDKLSMALYHTGNRTAAAEALKMALSYKDISESRRKRLRKNLSIFDPKSVNDDPEYYDEFWAAHPDPKSLEKLRIVKMAEMVKDAKSILDIGCGPGWIIDYLPQRTRYMGVDISSVARNMVLDRGGEVAASLDDVKGGWQVVILAEIIEHIEEDVNFMIKAADYLEPNGCLLVSVPRHKIMTDPAHVRDYTAEELDKKLGWIGEIVESLTYERWEIRKVKWHGHGYVTPPEHR